MLYHTRAYVHNKLYLTTWNSVTNELSSLKTTVMQLQGTVSVLLAKVVKPKYCDTIRI